jgi:acyl phosphate:glycerol-3-phosphate acyltransferase
MTGDGMDILSIVLAICAFWLGACPFSVWLGQLLLSRDIRRYGDNNPGATNVFRAGGRWSGVLALILDIGKGAPFVALGAYYYRLSEPEVYLIALCAMLGHAFSPFLRWKGGKAVAITGGILLALPQHEIFLCFAAFMFLGFLLISGDAWLSMLAPVGTVVFLAVSHSSAWEISFVTGIMIIYLLKQSMFLKTPPRFGGKLGRFIFHSEEQPVKENKT